MLSKHGISRLWGTSYIEGGGGLEMDLSTLCNKVAHMVTSHIILKVHDHCNVRVSLVEKAKAVQVHFTLGCEGLHAQRKVRQ